MDTILKFGGLAVVAYFAYQYWRQSTCADRAKAPFLLKIKNEAIDNYNALHAGSALPQAQPTQEGILKFLDGAYSTPGLTIPINSTTNKKVYDWTGTPAQKIADIKAAPPYVEQVAGAPGSYRSSVSGTTTPPSMYPAQVFVRAYVDYYTWQVNSGQYDETEWFCKEYAK